MDRGGQRQRGAGMRVDRARAAHHRSRRSDPDGSQTERGRRRSELARRSRSLSSACSRSRCRPRCAACAQTSRTPIAWARCTPASCSRSAPTCAHTRARAYYEAAFDSGTKMGELVVRDARPILVLSTLERQGLHLGRPPAGAGRGRRGPLRVPGHALRPALAADRRRLHRAGALGARRTGSTSPGRRGMPRRGMLWLLPGRAPARAPQPCPARGCASSNARRHV